MTMSLHHIFSGLESARPGPIAPFANPGDHPPPVRSSRLLLGRELQSFAAPLHVAEKSCRISGFPKPWEP